MASVVIAGDTSGTVTLQAPAIAGSTVLTLPTTSGTIVTTAGGSTVPFALGSAASPSITFTGDTNTGIFSPGADTIAFSEGGTEVMRLDSLGNILVGQTSVPGSWGVVPKIAVKQSSSSGGAGLLIFSSSNENAIYAGYDSTASVGRIGVSYASTGSYTPLIFETGGSETLRLSATSKALILAGGNASANGTGIAFPGTQSASTDANTLDDYEEGDWTPTITRSSTQPTITYTIQNGRYIKIGRMVYLSGNAAWSANSGGSGGWSISGLPFTNTGGSNGNYAQVNCSDFNGVTFASGRTQFGGYVNLSDTRIILVCGGSGVVSTDVTVGGSGYIYVTVCYVATA